MVQRPIRAFNPAGAERAGRLRRGGAGGKKEQRVLIPPTPPSVTTPPVRLAVSVAAIAGSLMLFQIALTRVFSFSIWHHFAFMVISIALLGLAVSGVILRRRPALAQPPVARASGYAVLFALAMPASVALVAALPFDPTRLGTDRLHALYLFAYYALLAVPFTFAGLALLSLLMGFAGRAERLYGSDLLGAGLGCVVAVPALQYLGAEGAILAAGAEAAAAGWLLATLAPTRARPLASATALALGLCAVAGLGPRVIPIAPGPSKGLRAALDRTRFPEARLVRTEWNAISRVDAVEGTGGVTWTVNPKAGLVPPVGAILVIDGDAATPIIRFDGDLRRLGFLDYMLSAAGLAAFKPEETLVIGAGGGVDVLAALYHGARHVDAVEINPAIVSLMSNDYSAEAGRLFSRPGVDLILGEGRSFVRNGGARYGAIQISLVDTWAASAAGAYSLAEAYLYTVEAFQDYLSSLRPGGFVTITRWNWTPPRETLRLCTVAAAALRRRGAERPREHVVVLGQGNLGNVILKASPFTPDEIGSLERAAGARGFEVLYAPGRALPENPFRSFFEAEDPAAFLASYPYDVTPTTDDSPFFFQFGRWKDASPFGAEWRAHPIELSGRLILATVFAQAAVFAVGLLVLPMASRRVATAAGIPAGRTLLYFLAIGFAFMFVEIALMQRLTLLLGHPVYAIALVLAVLLVSAGAGSLSARILAGPPRRPWPVFLGIVAVALLIALQLPALLDKTLGLGLGPRLLIGAAVIAPLGFLLGIPFPAALLRLAARDDPALIGWAWAANGCASVLGPILAVLLALDFGFSFVIAAAAFAYAAAYATFEW
jgi:hypothetical protein